MDGGPQTSRAGSLGLAALCATPALLAGLALLLWEVDPVLLSRLLAATELWLGGAANVVLLVAVPAALVGLLVYPPAWPSLRILGQRFKARLDFDRKAARDLVQRLNEFANARDLQRLGELYVDARMPQLAEPPLVTARDSEPENARTRFLLARCLQQMGRHADALVMAETAVAIDPAIGFGRGLLLAAEVALKCGRNELAMRRAIDHERRYGESIEGLYLRARAAHGLGKSDVRREALDRLLELPAAGKRYTPQQAFARARARLVRHTGGAP